MIHLRDFFSNHKTLLRSVSFLVLFSVTVSYAAPLVSPYNPGQTLDPGCAPGETNCTVAIGGGSSPWTITGSDIYYNTGKVGIGTTTPAASLDLEGDGTLLAVGSSANTPVPDLGSGTRMMWIPSQAAFRAGSVDDTQWDSSNVGQNSVSFGQNNIASGQISTAFGYANTASGSMSTVFGATNTASGQFAAAFGSGNTVSGQLSTIFGANNSVSGDQSFTSGSNNNVTGDLAVAFGINNIASAVGGAAFGEGNTVDGGWSFVGGTNSSVAIGTTGAFAFGNSAQTTASQSVAFGNYTTASGIGAMALGDSTVASGTDSLALGNTSTASGDYSIASGVISTASGTSSLALGGGTAAGDYSNAFNASNSTPGYAAVAFGFNNTASGNYSFVSGTGNTAASYLDSVFGRNAVSTGDATSWIATDPLFEVGNGADGNTRSNALTILKNGNTTINGDLHITGNLTCDGSCGSGGGGGGSSQWDTVTGGINYAGGKVGIGTTTPGASLDLEGDGTILAVGSSANTAVPDLGGGTRLMWIPSAQAFRVGTASGAEWNSTNVGQGSVAMGINSVTASGASSYAFGDSGITASGDHSFVFGSGATQAQGNYSYAFGYGAVTASGANAFALGRYGTHATAESSFAFGSGAGATNQYAFALGTNVTSSGIGSYAFGTGGTTASGDGSYAFGDSSVTASGLSSFALGTGGITAQGDYSYAFGYGGVTASGANAFAFGRSGTTASGANSYAFGPDAATASGDNSYAFGSGGVAASGTNSFAFGTIATASGNYATSFGHSTIAAAYNDTVFGSFNVDSTGVSDPANWVATDPLFEIGNGGDGTNGSPSSRSNALTILKNGNLGINTATPTAALDIEGDGTILAVGSSANTPVPDLGSGIRMMWIPSAAAFRAGHVEGTQWDSGNVGFGSVALGEDTVASGTYSVALGQRTTASSYTDVAFGQDTTASGGASFAFGQGSVASAFATVAGGENDTASGQGSAVFGRSNTTHDGVNNTDAQDTFIAGAFNHIFGSTSAGFGSTNTIGNNAYSSFIAGQNNTLNGSYSVVFGQSNSVNNNYSSAVFGQNNTVSGDTSIISGQSNTVSGTQNAVFGFNNTSSGQATLVSGLNNNASGTGAATIGWGLNAQSMASVVVGSYNVGGGSGNQYTWVGTDPLFEIGNGDPTVGSPTPSDALIVLKNGNIGIGTTTPQTPLDVVGIATVTGLTVNGGPITTVTTVDDPQNLQVSTVDDPGNTLNYQYVADGTHTQINYRVYAYKTVGGGRVYSAGYATLGSDISDDSSGDHYAVNVSWDPVSGATGYKIIASDGGAYDQSYETTSTSIVDDGCGSTCSSGDITVVPSSSSNTRTGSAIVGGLAVDNLGIANTNPTFLLSVGSPSVTTGTTVAEFANAGGTCDITPDVTGGVTCSSDMNLKKNIVNLSDNSTWAFNTNITASNQSVLAKILALNPVDYNWNTEAQGAPAHAGFIAQEVQKIFPDLVMQNPKTHLLSLNYAGLVPYTVEAIKEMNITLQALPTFSDHTLAQKVSDFLRGIAENGTAKVDTVQANKICVGTACVTQQQFLQMIQNSSSANTGNNNAPLTTTVIQTNDSTANTSTQSSETPVVQSVVPVTTIQGPDAPAIIPVSDPVISPDQATAPAADAPTN